MEINETMLISVKTNLKPLRMTKDWTTRKREFSSFWDAFWEAMSVDWWTGNSLLSAALWRSESQE